MAGAVSAGRADDGRYAPDPPIGGSPHSTQTYSPSTVSTTGELQSMHLILAALADFGYLPTSCHPWRTCPER